MNVQNKSKMESSPFPDKSVRIGFIEGLMSVKSDPNLTPKQKEAVKMALLAELNQMINLRLIRLMSEREQRELECILEKNASDKELDQFFMKKIPNLKEEIYMEMHYFRTVYYKRH